MPKCFKVLQFLLSLCAGLLACLLVFGCVSHVVSYDEAQDMYSVLSVKAHFSSFGWAYICLTGALAVLSAVLVFMRKKPDRMDRAKEYRREKAVNPRAVNAARCGVLIVSAVLIVLGIVNGGLYDVFVKAVNICTECIGLG